MHTSDRTLIAKLAWAAEQQAAPRATNVTTI